MHTKTVRILNIVAGILLIAAGIVCAMKMLQFCPRV